MFAPIPRIVHQTWKTGQIPDEWQPFADSWRAHHPAWEYRLWTDADNRRLIAERYAWFLATYDAFPRDIQRVDAAKYFILFTHGGVYADLDCECVRAVDPLMARGGAIVSRTRDGVIDCAFLASPAGHRFWPAVFSQLQRPTLAGRLLRYVPGFQASHVLLTTGTRMMTRAVRAYASAVDGDEAPALTVYEARYVSGRSWLDRHEPFADPEAFVRHHYSDSWLIPSERLVVANFTRRRIRIAAAAVLAAVAAAGRC